MREFLYEASKASSEVKKAVNKHCKKHGLPVKYGFSGLEGNTKNYYGNIPYISVYGNLIEIPYFGKQDNKKLADLLEKQSALSKIECQ